MPEPFHSEHDSYLDQYRKTGKKKLIGIGREVEGRRKNGDLFPIHLGVGETVVGDTRLFVGSITDLTEIKGLEKQLLDAHRMEAVGQLTRGIAHDFNNLLTIISSNAEFLTDEIDDEDEARLLVSAIQQASSRGASLANRLLAFSRQQTLSPDPTDVALLMGGLYDMLRRTLGETVEMTIEPDQDLWPAIIDSSQLENALINLAVNATDAMPTGGILTIKALNVAVGGSDTDRCENLNPGDYVMVSVTDTGIGMSPDVLEKAAEPFFTTKDAGQGSGLGLSMVYGFAKQSGGHLSIHSEVSQGTTINLYLPRSSQAAASEANEEPRGNGKGSERILVVEDDKFLREIPERILRDHGYEVVGAENGDEAICHLKDNGTFDLLFTDIILPGKMTGLDIAEEAHRLQPNIKVVYTTGYAESDRPDETGGRRESRGR